MVNGMGVNRGRDWRVVGSSSSPSQDVGSRVLENLCEQIVFSPHKVVFGISACLPARKIIDPSCDNGEVLETKA